MKSFIIEHKKMIAITGAVILLIAAIIAIILSRHIQANGMRGKNPQATTKAHDIEGFGTDIVVHTADEGEIIIEDTAGANTPNEMVPGNTMPVNLVADPDQIWTEDTFAGHHTPVEKAKMADGSLGVLTIDKIGLSANVYESPDNLEAMTRGIAHFPNTSSWDGCVGFSAHNINFDGSDGYFKNLHTLVEGDIIHYKTGLGERTYAVTKITTIYASDWSPLYYQDYNAVTLITCISGQPGKRLCVQATEQ